MGILEILFFLLATFSTVHAGHKDICPTSFCGNFSITYPFKLQNLQPENNCNYINLTCSGTDGTATVNLPYAGDFYVRTAGYDYMQLYDPGNCLMGRFMKNLNLSSSPFKAFAYENYTFYICPSNAALLGFHVFPIDCLSNSTNSTVATAFIRSDYMFGYGCEVIGSWLLPVLSIGQFDFGGINDDLYLTWNSTTCMACEDQHDQPAGTGGSKEYSWAKFAVFIPSMIIVLVYLMRMIKAISARNGANSDSSSANGLPISAAATTAPAPLSAAGGLDESKINSCTELMVLSESRINPGPDSNTCSICLESYQPKELVRSIAKCQHWFHADCIELWLRKNRTCPICRTILSEVDA